METYQNEDEQKYRRAKKRVEEIRGFYGNLTAYIAFNIFFLVINLMTSPEQLWFFWPMLGWGIGVFFHGMKVFNYSPFGKEWEERKVREFMEQEERRRKTFE